MFTYSVCYEVITPESASNGDFAENGFEFQDMPCKLHEIPRVMNLFSITPNSDNDLTEWWHSVDPERDYVTGEERYYSLHLKYNGRRLTSREFNRINQVLKNAI